MRWKKLKRTIYPCTFYFCQGGTVREIKARMSRLGLSPLEDMDSRAEFKGKNLGFTLGMRDTEGKFAVLIWVRTAQRNPLDVSIICHECLHATYYLFKYIGQAHGAVCYEDQEMHTYFLDYLVKEALQFFWKPQLNDVSF